MTHPMIERIRMQVENLLYPELRPYERKARDRLLQEASNTPHDLIEWLGILAALVFVGILTGYNAAGLGLAQRFVVVVMNFFVVLFVLALTAGPFLVRRTRRGLRSHLR
jgi:uncharacterized membrane protein YkgB